MGAWNCSINGNDTAQDLIEEYRAAFYYNDVNIALKKIFDYAYDYLDDDEFTDFMYSLADFMWKKGILTDEIKNKVIEMIDSGYGLEIWAKSGEKTLNKRKKVLNDFKKKLLSPQPHKKKISLKMNFTPIFNEGDIVTFKLKTADLDCSEYSGFDTSNIKDYDDKYIVLRKIYNHISYISSIEPNVKNTWVVFQIIPHYFDSQPTIDDIDDYLNRDLEYDDMIITESNMYHFRKRDYILLGNVKPKLSKDYEHDFNDLFHMFFSINKSWYRPDVEIIRKITELEIKKH